MTYYKVTHSKLSGIPTVDIDSGKLIYADFNSHHGMQCSFNGSEAEYKIILDLCVTISNAIKQIELINQK